MHFEKTFLATVAIDFGTTYSGFAFSFNKEEGEDAIFVNSDWENELGYRTSKTPTCLLLKPDLSFHSFGYKAVEKYANLSSLLEENEYILVLPKFQDVFTQKSGRCYYFDHEGMECLEIKFVHPFGVKNDNLLCYI